ncbi:oligosaccharide flippase family protein [Virgibacillus halodenitrificans]|uniref:lipopolysaccharide biosynthesis protein n=1 Tax=Virgibacillus halodenitrificans TaxID=1482 RepID=UPI0024C0DE0A|nr:oligosaccharide flippase family protein [Virgibacillus halodenitrificans]WHX26168.1 oligosaccharide flippase family protein [Virgibacillus halodenitrificans]
MFKVPKIKNKFLSSVLTILTGTTFAQALPVIASPLLTRIYSPTEFGEFGIFIAILGILSVVACFRFEQALALPKSDKGAINLLVLSFLISATFSAILVLFCMLAIFTQLDKHLSVEFKNIMWFLPLAVLLTGLYQAFTNWSIRKQKFNIIANTQFHRTTSIVLTQLGGGYFYNKSLTLMAGQIVGQLIAVIKMAKHLFSTLKPLMKYVSWRTIRKQFVRYKKFPIFYTWSALLNTASVQLPLFMLAFFFSSSIVGYYTLANRVLATPISIIGVAIAQPYLQKAVEKHRVDKLGEFSFNIFKTLITIGIVPMGILAIVAPDLFKLIFGNEWARAGVYVQFIALWLLFVFISNPLTHIFTILELQKESLYFNIGLFISRVVVLLIGGFIGNDILTIALFGSTGVFLWAIQVSWLLKKTGIPFLSTYKILLEKFLKSTPYLIPLIITNILIENNFLVILLAVVLCLVYMTKLLINRKSIIF